MNAAVHRQRQRQVREWVKSDTGVTTGQTAHARLQLSVKQIHHNGPIPQQMVVPGLKYNTKANSSHAIADGAFLCWYHLLHSWPHQPLLQQFRQACHRCLSTPRMVCLARGSSLHVIHQEGRPAVLVNRAAESHWIWAHTFRSSTAIKHTHTSQHQKISQTNLPFHSKCETLTRNFRGAMDFEVPAHRSFTNSPYLCAMCPFIPKGFDLKREGFPAYFSTLLCLPATFVAVFRHEKKIAQKKVVWPTCLFRTDTIHHWSTGSVPSCCWHTAGRSSWSKCFPGCSAQ